MFSSVNSIEQKSILIEEEEMIAKYEVVAECLNAYFVNITGCLYLNATHNECNIDVTCYMLHVT